MTPLENIHTRSSGVLCPVRLSNTNNILNGGRSSGSVMRTLNPSCQLLHTRRFSSAGSDRLAASLGMLSRIASSSCFSQGWSTALAQLRTPFTRTSPVAGWNRVISFAVPFLMCWWGWLAGLPSIRQLDPG